MVGCHEWFPMQTTFKCPIHLHKICIIDVLNLSVVTAPGLIILHTNDCQRGQKCVFQWNLNCTNYFLHYTYDSELLVEKKKNNVVNSLGMAMDGERHCQARPGNGSFRLPVSHFLPEKPLHQERNSSFSNNIKGCGHQR